MKLVRRVSPRSGPHRPATHRDILSYTSLCGVAIARSYTFSVRSAMSAHEYIPRTRSCARSGSCRLALMTRIALAIALTTSVRRLVNDSTPARRSHPPSASGCANSTMSLGRISGIPPTRVLTMNRPAHAASMMLIPNASVSEVER